MSINIWKLIGLLLIAVLFLTLSGCRLESQCDIQQQIFGYEYYYVQTREGNFISQVPNQPQLRICNDFTPDPSKSFGNIYAVTGATRDDCINPTCVAISEMNAPYCTKDYAPRTQNAPLSGLWVMVSFTQSDTVLLPSCLADVFFNISETQTPGLFGLIGNYGNNVFQMRFRQEENDTFISDLYEASQSPSFPYLMFVDSKVRRFMSGRNTFQFRIQGNELFISAEEGAGELKMYRPS